MRRAEPPLVPLQDNPSLILHSPHREPAHQKAEVETAAGAAPDASRRLLLAQPLIARLADI